MISDKFFFVKIPNYWLRCNVQYGLVGIIIGTFVNIIFRVIGDYDMPVEDILMTYLVSIIITLCITNVHLISDLIISKQIQNPVLNVLLNFGLIFIGVFIGSELSIACVSLLYKVPFSEIDQYNSLKRNMGLGFLAGTILYIYQLQRNNYQLKLNEKELQVAKLNELKTNAELKTLQARINPHFLYNSLNSITSLIHDDPAKAEEMTIKLSKLFRYSINTQESNWTTVKEELNIVDTYLDIEKIRFSNRIEFISASDSSVQNEMMPRFLLQPLVENALKHGLNNKSSGGVLKVSVKDQEKNILISVHDNGEPFPADLLAGYGLQSTHDKLNLLYGEDWKLEFVNEPSKQINIIIPKKKQL